jgi:hypothetical protein
MALISGQSVQQGPKQIPANPRLYNLIVTQAKSKFPKYPSPAAAHWVHSQYGMKGGKYVTSKKDIDPRMRDYVEEKKEKQKKKVMKKVTKPVGRGLIKGEGVKK